MKFFFDINFINRSILFQAKVNHQELMCPNRRGDYKDISHMAVCLCSFFCVLPLYILEGIIQSDILRRQTWALRPLRVFRQTHKAGCSLAVVTPEPNQQRTVNASLGTTYNGTESPSGITARFCSYFRKSGLLAGSILSSVD